MSNETKILELHSPTRRIKLVTPSPAEDETIAAFRVEPATLRYLEFLPKTMTTEEATARRESRAKNPAILDLHVFIRLDDGTFEFCGSTGVFSIDELQKSCEAGILVASKWQGQGLSAEIFYTLWEYIFEQRGLHRISMETSVDNAPMRGWLEKVGGIVQEGTRREAWTDNAGGWTNVASYAILESEWRSSVKARLEKRIMARASTSA